VAMTHARRFLFLGIFGASAFTAALAHADPITDFELATEHGCTANACDTVWCWGGEEFVFGGDKGVVSNISQTRPFDVATGYRHACVMWRDSLSQPGIVDCWGRDDYGQITVPEGTWRRIDGGWEHTCGIHWDYSVDCWGLDNKGQSSPPALQLNQVSAGAYASCGVERTTNDIECWGDEPAGVASIPASATTLNNDFFVRVSVGDSHACAVSDGGDVYCWGYNGGQAVTPLNGKTPVGNKIALDVGEMYHIEDPDRFFLDVSAGSTGTCAVFEQISEARNDVTCWGFPFTYGVGVWKDDPSTTRKENLYLPLYEAPVFDAGKGEYLPFEPERVQLTYNEVCAIDDRGTKKDGTVVDIGTFHCWAVWDENSYVEESADIGVCI
jgi:hypothetical protein